MVIITYFLFETFINTYRRFLNVFSQKRNFCKRLIKVFQLTINQVQNEHKNYKIHNIKATFSFRANKI